MILPLRPKNWSYATVLVFIGLTALPGLLYAVPVERFMTLQSAQSANAWFLALVAAWRVALFVWFLRTVAQLHWPQLVIATVLPLSAIVAALATLNLEHVVFEIMAGLRETEISPNDAAYQIVFTLSIFAYIAFPVTLISYVLAIYDAFTDKRSRA